MEIRFIEGEHSEFVRKKAIAYLVRIVLKKISEDRINALSYTEDVQINPEDHRNNDGDE